MNNKKIPFKEKMKKNKVTKFLFSALSVVMISAFSFLGVALGKYFVSAIIDGGAGTAHFGSITILEHVAEWDEQNKKYVLNPNIIDEISNGENTNKFDASLLEDMSEFSLPKDPFVVLSGKFEVQCELYLKVVEVDWPDFIDYEIDVDDGNGNGYWKPITEGHRYYDENVTSPSESPRMGIYQYKESISFFKGSPLQIPILKNNELTLAEHFHVDDDDEFRISFSVWVEQTNFGSQEGNQSNS